MVLPRRLSPLALIATGVLLMATPAARAAPAHSAKSAHGAWLSGVTVTEYWPVPEAWFRGAFVKAPGLQTPHRIDWLYSAQGVSMEGEGIGLDGRMYHIDALGNGGWVTAQGKPTTPANGWAGGAPFLAGRRLLAHAHRRAHVSAAQRWLV